MRWFALLGWLGLVWLAAAIAATPLVALFIQQGRRAQLRIDRGAARSRRSRDREPDRMRGAG